MKVTQENGEEEEEEGEGGMNKSARDAVTFHRSLQIILGSLFYSLLRRVTAAAARRHLPPGVFPHADAL